MAWRVLLPWTGGDERPSGDSSRRLNYEKSGKRGYGILSRTSAMKR